MANLHRFTPTVGRPNRLVMLLASMMGSDPNISTDLDDLVVCEGRNDRYKLSVETYEMTDTS